MAEKDKDEARITISITPAKGSAQVYDGKNLSSAADHLKENGDKAKGAVIEMTKTVGGETRTFVRRADGLTETVAALADAESWLAEVSVGKRSR